MVSQQRDLEQIDQRLPAFGGLEELRSHGQRGFPLVVGLFDIALLLELREQGVGAVGDRRGGEQRRKAVEAGDLLDGCLVAVAAGRGQGGGREGHKFSAKEAGHVVLAEELGDAAMDTGRSV